MRQCETCEKNLYKKQFCNLLSILDQSFLVIPLHSEKSSTNLVAVVGCHGIMVTMTMVSGSLLIYVSKGIIVFPLLNAAVFI